jgi:putative oxidoreductase
VIAGAVLEIVAGLLIAIGVLTRWAALALFVFTAINIYYFHDFWNLGGAELMTAFNKLSIMGALLILAAAGPGAPMAAEDLGRMSTPEIPERSAMP